MENITVNGVIVTRATSPIRVKGNKIRTKLFPTSVMPSVYSIEQFKQYVKGASFLI